MCPHGRPHECTHASRFLTHTHTSTRANVPCKSCDGQTRVSFAPFLQQPGTGCCTTPHCTWAHTGTVCTHKHLGSLRYCLHTQTLELTRVLSAHTNTWAHTGTVCTHKHLGLHRYCLHTQTLVLTQVLSAHTNTWAHTGTVCTHKHLDSHGYCLHTQTLGLTRVLSAHAQTFGRRQVLSAHTNT